MKRISLKTVMIICICTFITFILSSTACASEGGADLAIPVLNKVSGELEQDVAYHFFYKISSETAPVPEKDVIIITETGTRSFPKIHYDSPGIYSYTVSQVEGDLSDVHYDMSEYKIAVVVRNDDENGMVAYVAAVVNEKTGYKNANGIEFDNSVKDNNNNNGGNSGNSNGGDNSGENQGGSNGYGNGGNYNGNSGVHSVGNNGIASILPKPNTNDNSNINVYISIMILSGAGIIILIISAIRSKKKIKDSK